MLLNCGAGEDSCSSSSSSRRRLLRIPWTARSYNQSILKEISPEYSLEDWCWSWNSNNLATWCKELTHLKRCWCLERLKAGGKGDDREWDGWMASPTRWLEFEQALGVGDGQGSPACCSPWGCKESVMTEWLNWTEQNSSRTLGRALQRMLQWQVGGVDRLCLVVWLVSKRCGLF